MSGWPGISTRFSAHWQAAIHSLPNPNSFLTISNPGTITLKIVPPSDALNGAVIPVKHSPSASQQSDSCYSNSTGSAGILRTNIPGADVDVDFPDGASIDIVFAFTRRLRPCASCSLGVSSASPPSAFSQSADFVLSSINFPGYFRRLVLHHGARWDLSASSMFFMHPMCTGASRRLDGVYPFDIHRLDIPGHRLPDFLPACVESGFLGPRRASGACKFGFRSSPSALHMDLGAAGIVVRRM
ncbi:hypothetical protein B0H16DRAFT_1767525 [Mycena metata]|uniref:Uncharacterized protein n=1 Tax=Mycena metata TaxID=1033252 RepID=A0AAD7I4W3_9AGAR|nr:hypothetical protein B0H16DRAFT_1892513 [Mycena metata]KAJ7734254.1 hypothetical protein B0H16DRAFT_1767525 [Mycena metata]